MPVSHDRYEALVSQRLADREVDVCFIALDELALRTLHIVVLR